ncbi:MAG: DnaJ domain-containing protein, partial [Flavobacteriaceae bacterium]|nr:DnaJ domain-containing protein [Flavobacteriaceae bacterium]
ALDQEDAMCRHLHKAIRSYEKQMSVLDAVLGEKKWDAVVREVDVALSMEDDPPNPEHLWRVKCEAFLHLRDIQPGLEACSRYIEIEPSTIDGLLWRSDIHILNDDLEAAQADVRKADEFHNNNQRVREHQQKIENLKRMASRKDYYKILGVKKTAGDQEIRRAFRKLAMTLHPDQMRSKDITDEERAKNDALFRDINEAKEVLLDEEKRRRFDNGEDVTKPPEQQHQQHGGFQFPHGGNFHFHFG